MNTRLQSDKTMSSPLKNLQENLGYEFKDVSLLKTALTHSSYANENGVKCNERLEFVGDSILGFVSATYFYENSNQAEGYLTKHRAQRVCEEALHLFAEELQIGEALYLGKGEERMDGRHKPSVLADAFEAVLAAVYFDGGLEEAKKLALRFIARHDTLDEKKDYKTMLQEVVQGAREDKVEYVLIKEEGPAHDKTFYVEVHLDSNIIGSGSGKSKKNAEMNAAKEALILMGVIKE